MKKLQIIIGVVFVFFLLVLGYFLYKDYFKNQPQKIETKAKTIDDIEFKEDGKIHIVIDAGHGGPDPGAKNFKLNILEKNIARKIVDAIIALVDTSKYTVLETRPLDSNIHRHTRILLANKFKTDLLLSFHSNSFVGGYLNGCEIHISDSSLNLPDSTSKRNPHKLINMGIADTLSKNIAAAFPDMKRSGVVNRKDRIWMLYAGNYPSVLVEWGYINNKSDIIIMQDPVAHQVLARTVWKSIDQHFGFVK